MRQLYVWRDGKFIEVSKAKTRSSEARLQIITDEMPETWNPVDGKHYTSKKKMRDAARAAGCEEIGNETVKQREPEYVSCREDFERALCEHQSRSRK